MLLFGGGLNPRKSGSDTLYCFELIEKVYGIEKPTDGRDYEKYIVSKFTT